MKKKELAESPSVAIVIVNWNSFAVTAQCLESLRLVTYHNFKTLVVDNGSNDGSGDRLFEAYPEITLIKNEQNLGFTGGNNKGIQYGLENGYDFIMLLNNDTIVTPAFLDTLMASIHGIPDIAAIQPKIMFNYDRNIIWNAGGVFNKFLTLTKTRGERVTDTGQFDHLKSTDWITGCCFLIRSDVVNKIGLLDDKFFIYYEDTDWSLKIRNLGLKMGFEPKAVIFHEAGMSDANRDKHGEGNVSPFSHYQGVRNHLFMVRRYAHGVNLVGSWTYQLFKLTGYLIYFTVRGRFTKLKFVTKGIRDGILK